MKEAEALIHDLMDKSVASYLGTAGRAQQKKMEAADALADLLTFIRKLVEAQPAAAAGEAGWALVPGIGTRVKANHPITPLNPDTTFEVTEVRAESDGRFAVRGENTCWFGSRMLAAPAAPLVGEPRQLPVWVQPDHLAKARRAPFLCRVEPAKRDDFVPLYAYPAAPAGVPTQPNGQLKVAVDLLRVVVGPLEVSAACADEGAEELEALLANVKQCVDQFDRALLAGGDQKAAPLHPSSVQAVDGDEPIGGA